MAFEALTVKRYWDANANVPFLLPGRGVNGDAYLVSVAGNTVLGQTGNWLVGDIAVFALDRWVRVPVDISGVGVGVANVAEVEGLSDRPRLVGTAGEITPHDGKGALFFWNAGSTTPANGVSVINPPLGQPGRYIRIDQQMHFLTAGILSDDGSGGFVQNNGGIKLGGPNGIWLKQEGFIADNETGSAAMYSLVPNRWTGLSICPSGLPWDLPGEDVTSLGLQVRNGAGSEERIVFTSKWFGDEATGVGEYRIAAIKTGVGRHWPITFSNDDVRLMAVYPDRSTIFTNETFVGASGGNTVTHFKNPGTGSSFRAIVRPGDNVIGFERMTVNASNYVLHLAQDFVELDAPIRLTDINPALWFTQTDGLANQKKWFLDVSNGAFRGIVANDAENSFTHWLDVYRSGTTITAIDFAPVIGTASALPAAVDDAAAAAAGVRLYGFYQNSGALRQRLT